MPISPIPFQGILSSPSPFVILSEVGALCDDVVEVERFLRAFEHAGEIPSEAEGAPQDLCIFERILKQVSGRESTSIATKP
jgi:hypothetical protein